MGRSRGERDTDEQQDHHVRDDLAAERWSPWFIAGPRICAEILQPLPKRKVQFGSILNGLLTEDQVEPGSLSKNLWR